ncbi:dihydrofolate reductase family protein [uncultured Parasutterella sp.]|uniref:dihydrofolate reductase family protein n=1 Tax=uncultured Parasutterella sp. TaxID=1263098 RepID=UPI0025E721A6|nr:dihydrofolate reductase family protein [uncultured Parasutterella sp.]
MNRPAVICHMVSTIDGKIAGQSFAEEGLRPYLEFYVQTKQKFETQATVYGASTAKEIFVGKGKENFKGSSRVTDESDYICGEDAPYFVVVIDPLGGIPWKSGKPDGRPGLEDARIIVITSSQASKEYLNLLREKGIAYLISRGNEFHLTEPMEKLKSIFGIHRISLQGGGLVNGTFANEKLIDKLSLVVIPFVDSSSSVPTTFETGSFFKHPISLLEFKLMEIEKIEPEGLWLFYGRK